MTRYNDWTDVEEGREDVPEVLAYREGVDRVLEYIASIRSYPKLDEELRWAIKEGVI